MFEHCTCGAGYQRTQGSHVLAMEGGLHEAALVQPGLPVVGEQAIAEKWSEEF